MLKIASTERFSSRAEAYVRHRPSYPQGVISVLQDECGLTSEMSIADVASGTGIFTRLLLENGNRVFGIEPNEKMRRAGEEYLAEFPNFVSIAGTAEATALPNHCVQMITCAQAAHWFKGDEALREFQRILEPAGYVVVVFNDRQVEGDAFADEYEDLVVKYGTDYSAVRRLGRIFEGDEFFAPHKCEKRTLPNHQDLDYDALEGRLLSSSYAPQAGDAGHDAMLKDLRRIFDKYQRGGRVRMRYDTNIYFGRLS